jgi:RimJ/RimL family protein N-acetyltransferase
MSVVADAADEFETDRLIVRGLEPDDLEAALAAYTSNPGFLALTEGSGGDPGRYDLGMLQRDFAVARMTPGRQMAGIFLKGSGELVGVLDWMDENPSDGKPWVGLLMIRADQQRRRLASEAFEGLVAQVRARGGTAIRAGVLRRNAAGGAFMDRLGFEPISTTVARRASAEEVVVLERSLMPRRATS